MIIRTNTIQGTTVKEISDELYNNVDVMAEIRGMNLRGGDFIESIASIIAIDDTDVDTSTLWDSCK